MDTRDTREGLERRISIPSLQVRRALSGGMLISALLEDGKWATDTGLVSGGVVQVKYIDP